MIMLESAVKSNKDLAMILSQERLDVAKGRAPVTFPQYVSLLKSRAHELDAVDAKSSYTSSCYQSIHQVKSDGQSDRDGRRSRSGQRKGRGCGGRGSDDTDHEDVCGQEDYIDQDEDYVGQDEDYVGQEEDYYGQER